MTGGQILSRRAFIKVVSAAGGGLALGVWYPGKGRDLIQGAVFDVAAEAAESKTSGVSFSPNAWLAVQPDGQVVVTLSRSEMGQGVWTALPMILAEELDADWSTVRVKQADANSSRYGNQSTGGSYSVRGSWTALREAAAAARVMLIQAAAGQWKVDPSSCRTEKGWVYHSTGKKYSYGALTAAAAGIPAPEDISLKDEKSFRLLGRRIPRLDTRAKVTGRAVFGIDVRVPNMMFASIERCPVFGGKPKSVDASKTRAMPAVREVVELGDGVAVVATSTWAAFQGRKALTIDWADGPDAGQTSDGLWSKYSELAKTKGRFDESRGDAETAWAGAQRKIEAVYQAPFVAHATMEPMNCVADVRPDRCEIWAPTQNPQAAQREASELLDLPMEKVVVHVTFLGGGFGRRLKSDYVEDAVRVSRAVKAPVQVVWTREDDLQHDWYRPATYNWLRAGLDADGWPAVWMHRAVGPAAKGLVMGGSTPPYAISNLLIDAHIEKTSIPIGAWRAVGPSQNGFIVESFIDELAYQAKKDPFEYRRQLLNGEPRLKRVLEAAAEKSGWGTPMKSGCGRGIAAVSSFGSHVAQVAEVTVDPSGQIRVDRVVCAIDCGRIVNPDTIEAQMASGIVYGLGAALKDEITIDGSRVRQNNFDTYRLMTMEDMPAVEVHIVPSAESPGGVGEPGLPPAAPAVCNAIYATTGKRIRRLPARLGQG